MARVVDAVGRRASSQSFPPRSGFVQVENPEFSERKIAMRFLGRECDAHHIHARIAVSSWDTFD